MVEFGFVVVLNKHTVSATRGIFKLKVPYNNKEFKKEYYRSWVKLPGDRFKHCKNQKRLELLLKRVKNPYYTLK